MSFLIIAFLKIFFRNRRAMFFVILLPAGIFVILAFLRLEQIIRFDSPVSYEEFLLCGIIAFALMQSGIYTASYTLIDYRRAQILKRFAATPLTAREFIFAQSVARFLIALVEVAVLLVIGILFFPVHLHPQIVLLPALVFVGSTVFLNFGFLIASCVRNYEEAAPYTTIVGLSLTFLGDVFFSVKNLPVVLQNLAEYLPLKPLSAILRFVVLGVSTSDLFWNAGALLAWLIISTLLAKTVFTKWAYK